MRRQTKKSTRPNERRRNAPTGTAIAIASFVDEIPLWCAADAVSLTLEKLDGGLSVNMLKDGIPKGKAGDGLDSQATASVFKTLLCQI